jgi:beta-lactamase class A
LVGHETAAVPDEITVKVLAALQKHLGQMRIELEDQIHITEEKVIQKLSTMDQSHPGKMDEQQQPSKMKPA